MVIVKHKGDLSKTLVFLSHAKKFDWKRVLEPYAQEGVRALAAGTPVDSGLTASSWGYKIIASKGSYSILWTNSNVNQGVPIAIVIQYGHATRNGGYVQGIDFINPALKPIFDNLADEAWREVTNV